jgi:hypothetical protein
MFTCYSIPFFNETIKIVFVYWHLRLLQRPGGDQGQAGQEIRLFGSNDQSAPIPILLDNFIIA